jgi:uncharacterized protein (TIGR02453 family)
MNPIDRFSGFTQETFQFFSNLEENNYKPWFDEHKFIYESEVLQPLKNLAAALSPYFYEIDSQMDLRPARMISRIYRDIRFSKDKTPYKKHMWISFQRPFNKLTVGWESFPGFFMEIGKEGTNYGMGMFDAKKKIMDNFRDKVEYEQDHFKKITAGLIDKQGFNIEGEPYKRPIANNLPEYFQIWIQRRGLFLIKNLPIGDLLLSDKLPAYMEKEFDLLRPLYDFMVDVCD